MALEGSLTDFGLADILQLLYFQRKTGVLTLEGRMDSITLLFLEGNIADAESKKRTEDNRLGKILCKKGLIQEADLRKALDEQKKTGHKLGSILIRNGLVGKETILEILQGQVTETVIQIFAWKEGTYEFVSKGVNPDKTLNFSLDTQHLLMEGLRILDEWSLIKGKLTLDTVLRKKEESPDLSEEEKELFGYVDGENDVSTIIDLSAGDNFQVSKTLLTLIEKGLIEVAETVPAAADELHLEAKESPIFLNYLAPILIIISLGLSLTITWTYRTDVFKELEAAGKIDELRYRLETYRIRNSAYPQSLDAISHETDPWGRSYLYRVSGNSFDLGSAGPDGKAGTKDDIY